MVTHPRAAVEPAVVAVAPLSVALTPPRPLKAGAVAVLAAGLPEKAKLEVVAPSCGAAVEAAKKPAEMDKDSKGLVGPGKSKS